MVKIFMTPQINAMIDLPHIFPYLALEDPRVIRAILLHLALWDVPRARPPPGSIPAPRRRVRPGGAAAQIGLETGDLMRILHHPPNQP